jgi:hypothetical protein
VEWFIWLLIIYYGINLVILPNEVNKTTIITPFMAGLQAVIWIMIIVGMVFML